MSADINNNNYFSTAVKDNVLEVGVQGNWTISNLGAIEKELSLFSSPKDKLIIRFQCNGLENIDTSGAWTLYKKYQYFLDQGYQSEFKHFQEKHFRIVKKILDVPKEKCPDVSFDFKLVDAFIAFGKKTLRGMAHLVEVLKFLGQFFVTFFGVLIHPSRLRFSSIIAHIHEIGFNAIPIVALIAFLFSVVLSYQGAMQLRQFGAEIFMVNLTAASVLREIGVLMTAILVAGRSGSAFAAEIGVMKVREEIDALETIGVNIFEILVVPRVIALMISLPLLTIIADVVGLFGGGLMAYVLIDVSPNMYLERVLTAVTAKSLCVGLIKAPVFAFLIATVGTFRGLQVSGSADSIGRYTTIAVVQSILLIVFADALFAIIFKNVGM